MSAYDHDAHVAMVIAHYTDKRGSQIQHFGPLVRVPGLPLHQRRHPGPSYQKALLKARIVSGYQMIGPKGRLP